MESEHEYFKEFEEKLGEEGTYRHGVVCPKDLSKVRPTKEPMSVMGEYMLEGRTAKPKGSSIELGVAIR